MTSRRMNSTTLLVLLTCCLTNSSAHVVFEEIGTMVGSVSYLHCAISVDLKVVDLMITNATKEVTKWSQKVGGLYNRREYDKGGLTHQQDMDRRYYNHLQHFFEDTFQHIQEQAQDFKRILPAPPASHQRSSRSIPMELIKAGGNLITNLVSAPNFFMSLANGIFGTFMGLYNARQLNKLRQELATTQEMQHRLIAVTVDHEKRIRRVESEIKEMQARATIESIVHAPLFVASMDRIRAEIQGTLNTIMHAAQVAQQHRLAIDLLTAAELDQIYFNIQTRAEQLHYSLLTRMATDLFQVEVSYMYDGSTLMLILHVPMVPKQSYLTLFRLHPFPIPFSSERALMPKPTTTILAIALEPPRLTTTIELVDLINCHQINSVYVCERHGVLSRNSKATCLGALFENDLELAQTLCELELVPYQEYSLQLESNWFLVYSTKMFTSFAHCLNGSAFELQVKAGINKLFLDPACSTDLSELVLISDVSLHLDTSMKHFEWSQADLATFGVTDSDIADTINDLDNLLIEQELLLSEVLAHKKMRARVPWVWIWTIIGIIGFLSILLITFFGLGLNNFHRLRQRLLALRLHLGLVPSQQQPSIADIELNDLSQENK